MKNVELRGLITKIQGCLASGVKVDGAEVLAIDYAREGRAAELSFGNEMKWQEFCQEHGHEVAPLVDAGSVVLGLPSLGDEGGSRRQPPRILVLLCAAAAMIAVLLGGVLLLRQGGDSGFGEAKETKEEEKKEAPLVGKLEEMGVDPREAEEIAASLSPAQRGEWESYLLAIKDLPDKEDWEQLRIPPKGKLPDNSDLAYLIDEEKGLPRLAELAVRDQWDSAQWKDFDACVRHLLDQGTIFKKGGGAQPKPWVGRWRDQVLPGLVTERVEKLQKEASKSPGLVKEVKGKGLALWERDEFKEAKKLLADLPVPAAVAKNEPKKPETPKPPESKPEPEPPKPPRVIRRIVKREDLKTGITSTLLRELLETEAEERSGLYIYRDIGDISLDDTKYDECFLRAEEKRGPYGVYLGRANFLTVKQGGQITWNDEDIEAREKPYEVNRIIIKRGSDEEDIVVCPRKSSGIDSDVGEQNPLWGKHAFEIEAQGRDVLIKGELGKKLKELKGSPALQVVIKKELFELDAKEGRIKGVIPYREVYALKTDRRDVSGRERWEPGRGRLAEVLRVCKGPLEQLGASKRPGEARTRQAESKVAALRLYSAVQEVIPEELKGSLKPGLNDPRRAKELIGLAEYLLKISDRKEIKELNEEKKQEAIEFIAICELEIWTVGANYSMLHLLFKAKPQVSE
ncbi:MAG: hypothetical protein MK194_16150 [Roseibacillus sp.]|nr:hypothetical protein [Roseibacillus sp.]